MKKYHFLAICLLAVMTGFYFLSCSSDDDDNSSESSPIVGTWVSSYMDSYSRYAEEYVMFCADGTMYVFEYDRSHGVEYVEAKMEYVYNAAKNTLIIIEAPGYSSTIDVISLTNNKLILGSSSGSGYETYEKVKSPYTQAQLEKLYQSQRYSSSY